jgi:hypothetical protein
MKMRSGRMLAMVGVAGVAATFGVQAVFAATVVDNNVTPANTPVTATLKKGTKFKASASVSGIPVTLSCTGASFSFTTPASGLGPVDIATPTFSGCKDNFGGTDTVLASAMNGPWTWTFIYKTSKHPSEVQLGFPQNAGTFSSTLVSGCTGLITPNGPFVATGKYANSAFGTPTNTATFSGVKVPIGSTGCKVPATATVAATWVLSPNVKFAP